MARAAKYGGIHPQSFLDMEFEDGLELARRVTTLHQEDTHGVLEAHLEMTKAVLKSHAELAKVIAKSGGLR